MKKMSFERPKNTEKQKIEMLDQGLLDLIDRNFEIKNRVMAGFKEFIQKTKEELQIQLLDLGSLSFSNMLAVLQKANLATGGIPLEDSVLARVLYQGVENEKTLISDFYEKEHGTTAQSV